MTIKFTNNAETLLSTSSLADDDTSVAVDDGSVFPALSSGEFFYATLIRADALTTREIVKVTARSGNTLTIVRAQDNTSALTFSADDLIELRIVAATLESLKAADELTTGDAAVTLSTSAGNITIDAQGNDTDIILKGTDGSSDTTFLTIDGSDAGKATFNNEIVSGAVITSGAGLVIANAGNIGSVSDTDAIAIASNGVVTFSQIPVLPADTVALDDIATGDAAATLATTTGNITIDATANDSDIIFKGTDNTSDITMLTLDGSEAGAATFNDKIIATELDISGNIDIDGTANLDAVNIEGAVQIDSTVTVGVDDTGYDVKFFGDTASAYMLWDTSADDLILGGAARVVVPTSGLVIGSTAVTSTAAELNILDGVTSTAAELNALAGITAVVGELNALAGITAVVGELNALDIGDTAVGTAVASKAVILDSNKDYTGVRNLTISQDEEDANLGPVFNLTRYSASPAASDGGGIIQFVMENDSDELWTAAQIYSVAVDVADGTEDGKLVINTMKAGTATAALKITGGDVSLPTDAAVLRFGLHDDVLLTHVADSGLNMSVTGNNVAQLGVVQDKDDANTGPVFNLTRYSAGPADADAGGIIQFVMENDSDQLFTAAQIYSVAVDVTDTEEDGKLIFNTMKAGTATAALTLSELGTATFGGNIVIPDGGNIGSASDTDAIAIRSDGNIGIGTAASDTKQVYIYDNTTTDQLLSLYHANTGNGQAGIYLTKEGTGNGIYGQVNLGTSSAVYGFHNGDSSNVGIGTRGHSVSGYGVYGRTGSATYGGVIGFSGSGSNYGIIGYANTYGLWATSIHCNGTLTKVVDNFRIKHGLREGYDLFHSVIEGPQADLIYRGKVDLVDGLASIDIDSHYDMTPGTFEWLTKSDSVQTFTSNETGWDAVRSAFSGDTITIECQNSSSTDTISWMVIAERGDPAFRESEVTDNDGNMILERESEPPPPPPPPIED
jgi:hypothetical protein